MLVVLEEDGKGDTLSLTAALHLPAANVAGPQGFREVFSIASLPWVSSSYTGSSQTNLPLWEQLLGV